VTNIVESVFQENPVLVICLISSIVYMNIFFHRVRLRRMMIIHLPMHSGFRSEIVHEALYVFLVS